MPRRAPAEPATRPGPRREGLHHVGHSTHWIVLDGVGVLTDPWVTEPADGCLAHERPPAPLPRDPDVVLVSHEHQDHFDPAALALLDRGACVVLPRTELVDEVRALGFDDVRVPPADEPIELRGLTLRAPEGRHLVPERVFHLRGSRGAVFFGGDTMLTDELCTFARAHPADLAILPAERSTLFGKLSVMDADGARHMADLLGARVAVLSHHESRLDRSTARGLALSPFVRLDVATADELDERFRVPAPGDWIPYPWEEPS